MWIGRASRDAEVNQLKRSCVHLRLKASLSPSSSNLEYKLRPSPGVPLKYQFHGQIPLGRIESLLLIDIGTADYQADK